MVLNYVLVGCPWTCSIVTWRTSGISSKFLFALLQQLIPYVTEALETCLLAIYCSFICRFFYLHSCSFALLVDCLKLRPRKASILILESDSPMYSVTRFNQFLKHIVVLHLLVFLICIGLLFHSRGLIRVPDGVFTIKFSDFSFRHLLSGNFGLNCEPFSCHTVWLFAHV